MSGQLHNEAQQACFTFSYWFQLSKIAPIIVATLTSENHACSNNNLYYKNGYSTLVGVKLSRGSTTSSAFKRKHKQNVAVMMVWWHECSAASKRWLVLSCTAALTTACWAELTNCHNLSAISQRLAAQITLLSFLETGLPMLGCCCGGVKDQLTV